jgi:hypothetical protein
MAKQAGIAGNGWPACQRLQKNSPPPSRDRHCMPEAWAFSIR